MQSRQSLSQALSDLWPALRPFIPIDPHRLPLIAVVLLVTWAIAWVISHVASRLVARWDHLDKNTALIGSRLVIIWVWFTGLSAALALLGFQTASIFSAGTVAVVLGLAVQGYVSSVINGAVLLTEHHYALGDYIMLPQLGQAGTVMKAEPRYILLMSDTGQKVVVANSTLFTTVIVIGRPPSTVPGAVSSPSSSLPSPLPSPSEVPLPAPPISPRPCWCDFLRWRIVVQLRRDL